MLVSRPPILLPRPLCPPSPPWTRGPWTAEGPGSFCDEYAPRRRPFHEGRFRKSLAGKRDTLEKEGKGAQRFRTLRRGRDHEESTRPAESSGASTMCRHLYGTRDEVRLPSSTQTEG